MIEREGRRIHRPSAKARYGNDLEDDLFERNITGHGAERSVAPLQDKESSHGNLANPDTHQRTGASGHFISDPTFTLEHDSGCCRKLGVHTWPEKAQRPACIPLFWINDEC